MVPGVCSTRAAEVTIGQPAARKVSSFNFDRLLAPLWGPATEKPLTLLEDRYSVRTEAGLSFYPVRCSSKSCRYRTTRNDDRAAISRRVPKNG
jgi:hypothetical protein